MGTQPGQTSAQPVSFDPARATAAMQQYQTALNAPRQQLNRSYAPPTPGFEDLMNYYMQAAATPAAPAATATTSPAMGQAPTAFQQFRQQRATGMNPGRRTMQYTPPSGPRMARDNRVAGDLQA